jgi:hypothetical protein
MAFLEKARSVHAKHGQRGLAPPQMACAAAAGSCTAFTAENDIADLRRRPTAAAGGGNAPGIQLRRDPAVRADAD